MNTTLNSLTITRKTLSVIAIFALVFLSGQGIFVQTAHAAVGEVNTVTGSCGAPVNENQYAVGDPILLDGKNFDVDTPFHWTIAPTNDANNPIAEGDYVTGPDGSFCFTAINALLEAHIGGPYKATVLGKTDNFNVVSGASATGNITIVKNVNDVSGQSVSFDFTSTFPVNGNFSLNGGDNVSFNGQDAGQYTVTEGTLSGDWSLVNASCDAQSGWSFDGTDTLTINIVGDENLICTFYNEIPITPDLGSITILKSTDDKAGDTTEFDFIGDNGIDPFTVLGDNTDSEVIGSLAAGTYTITESAEPEWKYDSVDCGAASVSPVTNGVAVTLGAGEDVSCTFSNTYDPAPPPQDKATLHVVKKLIQDNGGTDLVSDFLFDVNGGVANGATWTGGLVVGEITYATTTFTVKAGNYSVTERSIPTVEGRYSTSYDNCTKVVLNKDDEVTCTITNNDISPRLIVKKIVNNDYGTINPSLSPEDFTMLVTGTDVSSSSFAGSETGVQVNLDAGPYSVDEEDAFGYFKSASVDCSGTIDIGDRKTCTITNNDEAIYGCTDPAANNYNETATDDNGKCDFNYLTQCVESPNLLQNGSFEEPIVTDHSGQWQIFPSVPGWIVSLSNGLELWRGIGVGPSDGEQNVELDGNDATKITQTVATVPGATYELNFDFAARAQRLSEANNHIEAAVDGDSLVNVSTANTNWLKYGATFVADGSTDVSFTDLGTPQNEGGTGTLLDNAVLCLVSDTYIIEGYVWHDDNKNEDWEGFGQEPSEDSESPLEGWTVNITNGEGIDLSTQTDEDGYYRFEVPEGTWTITEEVEEGWERTTKASHVVTVPELEEITLLDTVLEFIIPTAHAASAVATYGPYNFGNDLEEESIDNDDDDGPTSYTSGTRTNRTSRPTPQVQGISTSAPTPIVLGEQVSVVPTSAPNAGGGGASPVSVDFGNIAAMALLSRTRRNG